MILKCIVEWWIPCKANQVNITSQSLDLAEKILMDVVNVSPSKHKRMDWNICKVLQYSSRVYIYGNPCNMCSSYGSFHQCTSPWNIPWTCQYLCHMCWVSRFWHFGWQLGIHCKNFRNNALPRWWMIILKRDCSSTCSVTKAELMKRWGNSLT